MPYEIDVVRDHLYSLINTNIVGGGNIARKAYNYRTLPADVSCGIAISYTGGRVVSNRAFEAERFFTIILAATHDKSEAGMEEAETNLLGMTQALEELLVTYNRTDYWMDIEWRQPSLYPDTEKGNRTIRMAWIPIVIKSR